MEECNKKNFDISGMFLDFAFVMILKGKFNAAQWALKQGDKYINRYTGGERAWSV